LTISIAKFSFLNEHRQIIYANKTFLASIELQNFQQALGERYGNLVSCVNSQDTIFGCGTGKNCRYCGVILTFLKAKETGQQAKSEAIVDLKKDNHYFSKNVAVNVVPFDLDKKRFYFVVITDISNLKRREYLERIFLHDFANYLWALSASIEFFPRDGSTTDQENALGQLTDIVNEMIEEFELQRDLINLENKILKVNLQEHQVHPLIESVIQLVSRTLKLQKASKYFLQNHVITCPSKLTSVFCVECSLI